MSPISFIFCTVNSTVKKMKEMGDNYVYIAVNSTGNKPKDDVVSQNTSFLKQHKLSNVPVLIDHDGAVGKMYDARTRRIDPNNPRQEQPVRVMYYNYDAQGKPTRPEVFTFHQGQKAEEAYRGSGTFPHDNPFRTR